MDKEKVRTTLEKAIRRTCQKYADFQGVLLYGSFVTAKLNPSDIDLIPVLGTCEDNWDLSSSCEDCSDHGIDYYKYREIEKYLGRQFSPLPDGFDTVFKTDPRYKGLIHISAEPGIIALDNTHLILGRLEGWNVDFADFIGKEEARQQLYRLI